MSATEVLIVENNELSRELVADLLQAAGYVVLQAESAGQGLELARTFKPALILMDLALPEMDGLQATHDLKAMPETRDIPVVAVTAHALPEDREKALAAGCVGYLTKPIDTRTFAADVRRFIEQSTLDSAE